MGIAPGILWELFSRIMGIWGLDIMGISGYVIWKRNQLGMDFLDFHGNMLVIEPRTHENIVSFDGDIMVFMGIEW